MNDVYSTLSRVKTDGAGSFTFGGLSDGSYKVKVMPYGTDYEEQIEDVTLVNYSRAPGGGATSEQISFYLKPRASTGPFAGPPGVIFAQNVPDEAKKLYEEGVKSLSVKKENEGFDALKRAIEIYPQYYSALERLGTEYVMRGYYTAAFVLLTQATEVNPRGYPSVLGLGLAQFYLKQNDEAIANLKRATTLYDKSPNAFMWLGMALRRAGKKDEALTAYTRANNLSKGKVAQIHMELARLHSEENRYAQAATELELYLKYQQDAPDADKVKQIIQELRKKAAEKK
jgi:tetratricopeptide (TPR) repeat protein